MKYIEFIVTYFTIYIRKKKSYSLLVEELNRHSPGYDCWTSCWGMTRYPSAASLQETSNLNVPNHWILLCTSQSFSGIPPFCLILLTLLRRTNCCFHDRICKVSLHKERSKAGGTKFVIQHVSSTFGQHLTHCFSFLFFVFAHWMCFHKHTELFLPRNELHLQTEMGPRVEGWDTPVISHWWWFLFCWMSWSGNSQEKTE